MPKNLRERLSNLTGRGEAPPEVEVTRDAESVRERLRRLLVSKGRPLPPEDRLPAEPVRRSVRAPIEELVDGAWEDTPFGRVFVVERRLPAAEHHAGSPLDAILAHPPENLALVEEMPPAGFAFSSAIFLDTETTGLAGGTGTFPFLVGLGRFEGDEYVLRQFFLDDPGAERGLLNILADMIGGSSGLVTYNGKAFDWPLVKTRFVLNGIRPKFLDLEPPHVDLLSWARRLWKLRLGSCSLADVERGVMGLERTDDIPGAEIPALYFAYLRGAPVGERMARVFYHNEFDIKSLAVLAARALNLAENPIERYEDPAELYACCHLPRMGDRRGELLSAAIAVGLPEEIDRRARWELSLHHKRRGELSEARTLWGHLRRGPYDLRPYEEEAKFLEHGIRDLTAAKGLVEEALQRCGSGVTDSYARARQRGALMYRLKRIERKLAGLMVEDDEVYDPGGDHA
ncbi:MAG: ribonuclease H-like domain-containing protein [bacterium]|nr:ribonuclease H-like domain-containing protein [bacterium]